MWDLQVLRFIHCIFQRKKGFHGYVRVPIRLEISFWCSNNIVFGMLKCTITFDVLRHLWYIHRSWSPMWNCRLMKWMGLNGPQPLVTGSPLETTSSNLTFSEQVAQGHGQSGFEYLRWLWLHSLPQQPVPVFDHSHKKKVFSCVQKKFCLTCAQCPLQCQRTLQRNVLLPLPYSPLHLPPQQVFINMEIQGKH